MRNILLVLVFTLSLCASSTIESSTYVISLNTNDILIISIIIFLLIFFIIYYYKKKLKILTHTNDFKQEKLMELFDKGSAVLFRWNNDKGYSVDYVSQNVESLLGYTKEEFLSEIVLYDECIYEDDAKRVEEEVLEAKKTNNSFFKHKPYRVVTKNDEIKWVLDSAVVVKNKKGKITSYLGYIIDITDQITIQDKLKESELRWKFAVDGNGDGLWDWNIKTNQIYFSKTWKKLLGYKKFEINNEMYEWDNRIHPDDKLRVKTEIEKHLLDEVKQYKCEYRLLCKNGTYKWVLDRGIVVEKDEDNTPLRMIGTHSDIDQNKKLIQKVESLRYRFESMFNNHDAIMLLISPHDGTIIAANKSAQNFYGYSYLELKFMNISDINVLNSEELKKRRLEAKISTDNCFEFIHKLKNGEKRVVEVHSSPIETDEGILLFSIIKDITNEKEIEKKFKKEKVFINSILETANVVFAVIDNKGRMTKLNKYGLEFSGYSLNELTKEPYAWTVLIPKEVKEKVKDMIDKANAGEVTEHFENGWISKSGDRKLFEWSNTLVRKEDGSVDYVASIGIDITDKKLLESQSKLVSMGEMIGNIAHQWRQPLSVITTTVSGLKLKAELTNIKNEDIDECVENVIKQSKYLSKTIDNFRDFIKGDKEYKQISIRSTIVNALTLLEASLKNNYINLTLEVEDDIRINGNIAELTEGLINIINNSKDILKTEVEKEFDRLLFISTKKVEENKLELKILDSGGGIDKNIIERIFEPYFTTKHQSQGTGLGLSMADKIIRERHKGTIRVYNEDFKHNNKSYTGACFHIVFSGE